MHLEIPPPKYTLFSSQYLSTADTLDTWGHESGEEEVTTENMGP